MKTKTTKLTIIMAFLFLCMTLPPFDCDTPTGSAVMDANNVKTTLKNGGDLWWNGNDAKYVVPKPAAGSGLPEVSAIFAGALWMGAIDPSGELKLAAQQYGANSGQYDYFAGPLNENGTTDFSTCSNFDRIWSTNKSDIDTHIADFADNGMIDGPVPESVLAWPGRLSLEFEDIHGFELPDYGYNFAPFVDQNSNGSYEPNLGDYPNINGADQGHWTVFNDNGNVHTETDAPPLKMEVHLLAYAYASSDEAINNTTFYDYKFVNKSNTDLDSFYVGLWVDPDLGCFTDDYIGCSPEHDLAYVYNMDAQDGTADCSCPGGINTYCEEIPVIGFKILRGPKAERIYLPNGELVFPPSGTEADTLIELGLTSLIHDSNGGVIPSPIPSVSIPRQYYNFLTGKWPDGTPITYGGDGYDPTSTDTTHFVFSDNPSDPDGWSMCQENTPASDSRMVLGLGPSRMVSGAINSITFAVVFKPEVPHPCPDIGCVEDVADEVQDFYDDEIFTSIHTPDYDPSILRFVPNPFTNQSELIIENTTQSIEQVQLFSINGQLLRTYNSLSSNRLTVERGNLSPGMYVYKARTNEQKMYTGKFVIQ